MPERDPHGVTQTPARLFCEPILPTADGFSIFTHLRFFRTVVIACLLAVSAQCVDAAPVPSAQQRSADSLEIGRIRFVGNESASSELLSSITQSQESPGGISRLLYWISFHKLGAEPEFFNDARFREDASRIESFYHDQGFYDASVTPEVRMDSIRRQATLIFLIKEHNQSHIDSIAYHGLEGVDSVVMARLADDPLLKVHRPFIKAVADAEIRRILGILVNGGYASARLDSRLSGAYRYLSTNNFVLVFTFQPGRQYRYGHVSVEFDPPADDLDSSLILRHLEFQEGQVFGEETRAASQRNLNRIDLFESVRLMQPRFNDSAASEYIPMKILARPRDRRELSPEITISDENNAFNLGLGLGYTKRNFFGDARTMTIRGRSRFQSLANWNLGALFGGAGFRDSSVRGALELQLQIVQPYLFTKSLSGTWETSISAEKQEPYILSIVRNKVGLNKRFAVYTSGSLEWTLERSSPDFLVTDRTPAEILATIREADQPQFNSILTFTVQRDRTNDLFSPSSGFFHSLTLEESGILPKLLPGLRANLPFTQYYKTTLFGRWYQNMTADTSAIVAMKLKLGYQAKYGDSRNANISIPLNRRFFSGGSGSVRGWRPRELGAMADPTAVSLGGNFLAEASMEYRFNPLHGAGKLGFIRLYNIWGVLFADAGNVWSEAQDFRVNQMAAAVGFGFRYETYFGPFRVDYGMKAYDPQEGVGHQTIFQKRFWGDTFSSGVLHFGIGHSF